MQVQIGKGTICLEGAMEMFSSSGRNLLDWSNCISPWVHIRSKGYGTWSVSVCVYLSVCMTDANFLSHDKLTHRNEDTISL